MDEKKLRENILKAFSKIEIEICDVCGSFISKEEKENSEGACYKCWEK